MDLGDEIFRVLLETTPVGIFLQCSGRFMYVNPTLASILETTPGNLIGSSIYDFVHPEDRGKVAEIAKRRDTGEKFTEKYIIIYQANKLFAFMMMRRMKSFLFICHMTFSLSQSCNGAIMVSKSMLFIIILIPSLPQTVKFPSWKLNTHAC